MKKFTLLFLFILIFSSAPPAYAYNYNTADGNIVSITSPNGGEVYKPGNTIPFRWSSTVQNFTTTITYVNIYKLKGTGWDSVASDYNLYVDQNDPYEVTPIKNSGFKDTGQLDWKIPEFWNAPGYYVANINVSYWNNPTAHDGGIQADWSDHYFTIAAETPAPGLQHAVGTNISGMDGTVYRISEGNYRSPYTSAGAFLSYKFNNWGGVVPANSADMALPLSTYTPCGLTAPTSYYIPPRNGSLINDHGTVYLISNGQRAGFASAQAFLELGYSFQNVYPGDTSFMCLTAEPINTSNRKHADGTLINDNGTLYVMKNGYRVGFPSMAVLDSWGYWASEAVPANNYDRQAEVSGVMQTRLANQMSI